MIHILGHAEHLFPITHSFWFIKWQLRLVVEVFNHHILSVLVLLDKKSPVPHVHHLVGSFKVSVASTVNANYAAGLPFDLPGQRKETRVISDGHKDYGF
jgi:hypothetical protein